MGGAVLLVQSIAIQKLVLSEDLVDVLILAKLDEEHEVGDIEEGDEGVPDEIKEIAARRHNVLADEEFDVVVEALAEEEGV